MSLRSVIRRADERRRAVPLGVQLLGAFAVGSIALLALVAFGPELPGPNVSELVTGTEESVTLPCDPKEAEVREPDQPVDAPGVWRDEEPMPIPRDELRAAAVDDRIILLNGQAISEDGEATSIGEAHEYDPATGTYKQLPETPVPVDHSAVVTYRGDVYLVGGDSNGQPLGELWRYSPDREEWEELTPMQTPRAGHGAAVIGDRLYVVGGTFADSGFSGVDAGPLASLEIYDFRTGEWSSGPDMPTPRHHLAAAAVDGQLYAIGGRMPGDFSIDAVERFDPSRGEWEAIAPLPLGTGGPSAVRANGSIIVVGGGDDLEGWVTPATWSFDPQRDRWRRLADQKVPRHGHASAALGDRVFVFGGAPCADYGITARVESLSTAPTAGS